MEQPTNWELSVFCSIQLNTLYMRVVPGASISHHCDCNGRIVSCYHIQGICLNTGSGGPGYVPCVDI